MTWPESSTPDRPFAGAHSTVPGARSLPTASSELASGGRRTLPLEAVPSASPRGWAVRLAVRAEQVTVSKDLVVRERAVVRRTEVADVALMEAEVRREELRTSTEGAVEFDTPDENIRGGEARRYLPGE